MLNAIPVKEIPKCFSFICGWMYAQIKPCFQICLRGQRIPCDCLIDQSFNQCFYGGFMHWLYKVSVEHHFVFVFYIKSAEMFFVIISIDLITGHGSMGGHVKYFQKLNGRLQPALFFQCGKWCADHSLCIATSVNVSLRSLKETCI
ncbi:hypothetical protein OPIT5_26725 [Opitutaceae bacterium TAV5]|nr:hypothetical protein OPIT5_26725 [Opitutaceae bacterium TAV5]